MPQLRAHRFARQVSALQDAVLRVSERHSDSVPRVSVLHSVRWVFPVPWGQREQDVSLFEEAEALRLQACLRDVLHPAQVRFVRQVSVLRAVLSVLPQERQASVPSASEV